MSAFDACEGQVIAAFKKAGWHILDRQYPIPFGVRHRRLYADLKIQSVVDDEASLILVVECKCFDNPKEELKDFYQAIGQYETYRAALSRLNLPYPVYLALPNHIYETLFQEPVVQSVIESAKIKLVVIDLTTEEIIQWIH